MEAIFNSFLLVFISEMGDKTQLLSLVLTARYKQPWVILAGVFTATLLNHAMAAWAGEWAASLLSPSTLKLVLAVIFFVFAVWILIPDKEGELKSNTKFGVFFATVISFFLAEMGDKTQLATIALAAKYSSVTLVTLGTTIGMLGSNALGIFLGDKILQRIPMKWVRILASLLFAIFGLAILVGL